MRLVVVGIAVVGALVVIATAAMGQYQPSGAAENREASDARQQKDVVQLAKAKRKGYKVKRPNIRELDATVKRLRLDGQTLQSRRSRALVETLRENEAFNDRLTAYSDSRTLMGYSGRFEMDLSKPEIRESYYESWAKSGLGGPMLSLAAYHAGSSKDSRSEVERYLKRSFDVLEGLRDESRKSLEDFLRKIKEDLLKCFAFGLRATAMQQRGPDVDYIRACHADEKNDEYAKREKLTQINSEINKLSDCNQVSICPGDWKQDLSSFREQRKEIEDELDQRRKDILLEAIPKEMHADIEEVIDWLGDERNCLFFAINSADLCGFRSADR